MAVLEGRVRHLHAAQKTGRGGASCAPSRRATRKHDTGSLDALQVSNGGDGEKVSYFYLEKFTSTKNTGEYKKVYIGKNRATG